MKIYLAGNVGEPKTISEGFEEFNRLFSYFYCQKEGREYEYFLRCVFHENKKIKRRKRCNEE